LVNVYQIGSRVYGTADENSDWDFVSVVRDGYFHSNSTPSMLDYGFVCSALVEVEEMKHML